MPYKDPAKKRAWDADHRPERSAVYMDAAKFADEQIATLKALGTEHTAEEWRALRTDLIKATLSFNTIRALSTDPQAQE